MNRDAKFVWAMVLMMVFVFAADCAAGPGQDWLLGFQSYTFHRDMSFEEVLANSQELGLKVVEAFPNHGISKSKPHLKMHYKMDAKTRQMVKGMLAKYDVKLANYGVVSLPNDEERCREVFDFAKEMGIETLVSEPPAEAFDLIDRLCQEYQIKVAIHNHPKPSTYWNPDTVLEVCEGRSKWIGACADTGHWMRSGVKPIEALRKLEGRIISFHLKDLNEFGNKDAHDVVWGTGKIDMDALLAEMARQGFKGVFSIEYEHNWGKALPEITECVNYFNKKAKKLDRGSEMAVDSGKWQAGICLYSFNKYPLVEAIEKAASLGVDWVEGFAWHQYSAEREDVQLNHTMPAEVRAELKDKLKVAGVKLGSYFGGLGNDERGCRETFDFAKDMGIEIIVAEPEPEAFDLIDRLAQEYRIKVAVHNHPKESEDFPHKSLYWRPENVLEVLKGRSEWIGVCADTGHWSRCGIDAVEALKKLEGRIFELHLKDLNEFDNPKDAHDVPWGTGQTGVKAIMTELKRQGFAGPFLVEYEHNWLNSVPEIRESLDCWGQVSRELGMTEWEPLFNEDLSNAVLKPDSWVWEDGVLTRKGGSYIWTKDKYGDFVLELDFKVAPGANSGVFLRTGSLTYYVQSSIEVQIHDTTDGTPKGQCGAVYDCLAPSKDATRPAGQWNRYVIRCEGDHMDVHLNGEHIIDMDMNDWKLPHKNPDGTRNKFDLPVKKMPREGFIGLQDHGDSVWFRNLRIKRL